MAIAFSEQKKRQNYLLLVFLLLSIGIVAILIFWFVKKNSPEKINNQTLPSIFRQPNIDFKIFEDQTLKDLELFGGIKPFEGKAGRDNPFIPY